MEVRIGIKHSPRELAFETEAQAEEVRALFEQAAEHALVALSDTKGRQYLIDSESVAYVELGGDAGRKVGFIS
ncbi:DUF3107 domain-containing protein [Leucobacter rhizosphaerae]|uniref:DUF3107 domain-containing protein n=1 Tax=Leucobacter rhizosphaerae TaxID=2932245 RepID=A0ABY4FWH5_9MICO|nr:DUF3107 domain-containing protein [Leucobacter rhizosphaerae]UOQ60627.1 DUF3107 domain-containing protein [Leucobacter rhizosphaerae]